LAKNIFIFYAIILSSPIIIHAQSFKIKGVVTDSLTREKIESANLLLFTADSTFYAGCTSDSTGNFVFSIKENKPYLLRDVK
jgi:hypothetical protein